MENNNIQNTKSNQDSLNNNTLRQIAAQSNNLNLIFQ